MAAAVAPNHNHAVHRASALFCIVAGAVLCIPGIALSAVGNDSTNESTRYSYHETNSSHRVMRGIGPLLLICGLALLITGMAAYVHLRRSVPPPAVICQQPVVGVVIQSGGAYPPVGFVTQPNHSAYPQQLGQTGYIQQPYTGQPGVPQPGYLQQPYVTQQTAWPVVVAIQPIQGNYPMQAHQMVGVQQTSHHHSVDLFPAYPSQTYPSESSAAPPKYDQAAGYPDQVHVPEASPPSYEDVKK